MAIRLRHYFIFFFLILVIALCILAFYAAQIQEYIREKPIQIDEPGVIVLVPRGMKMETLALALEQNKVLEHPYWFLLWIRYTDVRKKIKAGEYLIKPGMTLQAIIDMMIAGRVVQHSLTIVPGWNFDYVMDAVSKNTKLSHTLADKSKAEIMAILGHPDENPEGRFFPDTYHFPLGTTDLAFLKRAFHKLDEKLYAAWENRDPNLFLKTPYEALILASIIEKETNVVEEYPEIAGVFIRRLERNMPLQADPTVIYGAKNYNGQITKEMLNTPTEYNTYLRAGLPPTPIAMPGEKAIYAATHPKPGNSLYFVARGQGPGHVFSATLDEHQQAVTQYRQAISNTSNPLPSQSSSPAPIMTDPSPSVGTQ